MKNHHERLESIYKKAGAYHKQRAKTRKILYSTGTTAVCAAVIVLCITVLPGLTNPANDPGSQTVTDTTADVTGSKGVTIPALILPEQNDGATKKMIGLVVYNGRIYTQAQIIDSDQAALEQLLGEKLGTASGSLNEWSSQSEYDKEFASTVTGDVYAVNGYDKEFRICVSYPYSEGRIGLSFLENLNGITVNTGADLYGKLQLKENYTGVKYQLQEDWDYSKNNFKTYTDLSDDQIKQFVDALYSAPFEDLSQQEDIYSSNLRQAHLYFTMKDGTTVGVRLFENGYVAYEHMFDRVFVHVTDDIFNAIFEASTK